MGKIKRKSEEPKESKKRDKLKVEESVKIKSKQILPTNLKDEAGTSKLKKDELDPKEEPEKIREEKWQEGEKILCFHGPLIYDAKIQRVEFLHHILKAHESKEFFLLLAIFLLEFFLALL